MKHRYAVFGKLNDFLGDILAENEQAALAKAKTEWPYTERVILIKPGNDLGVHGLN